LDSLGAGSRDDLATFARRVAERALAIRLWSSAEGWPSRLRAACGTTLRTEFLGGRLILTEVRTAEHVRRGLFRSSPDGSRLLLRFADDADSASDRMTAAQ
jgi:hypothetical protein